MLLAIFGVITWSVGSVAFASFTFVRLLLNLYRVNALSPERAEVFVFRAP